MRNFVHMLGVGLLAALLVSPVVTHAQEDEHDVRIEESEDGNRVIILEDEDGDRSRIERRIRIRPDASGRRVGRPHLERHGEIIFRDESGEERRFSFNGDRLNRHSDDNGIVSDTTIGGNRVIIIRTPDGEEQVLNLDMRDFEFPVPHFEMNDFEMEFPDDNDFRFFVNPNGSYSMPFGPGGEFLRHFEELRGASKETREEMLELERRSAELAAELREHESEELERELDRVLEQLFELRGQARLERADNLEERAQDLRREAEELREAIREREDDRRALIEERKRDLLGRGNGW